jgi:hypothetical protein
VSLPVFAPEPELISPAGPLLDRFEALQRRHRIPEQQPAAEQQADEMSLAGTAQHSLLLPETETSPPHGIAKFNRNRRQD